MKNRKIITRSRMAFTFDLPEEFGEGVVEKNILMQLAHDINRKFFTINGKSLTKTRIYQLARQLARKEYIEAKTEEELKNELKLEFIKHLLSCGFSPEQIKNFFRYYSQRIAYAGGKLAALMSNQHLWLTFEKQQNNLFLFQGKVFFKSITKNLSAKDLSSSEVVKNFNGSIKSYFKLTHKGFVFNKLIADEEMTSMVDYFLVDKNKINEYISLMKLAIENKNIELYIFNLLSFKYYLKNTLLNAYQQLKEEEVYGRIIEDATILTYFSDHSDYNEIYQNIDFLFQKHNFNNVDTNNMYNKTFIKYLCMYSPVETLLNKINNFVLDDKARNYYKLELYEYQIQHASHVYSAQMKIKNHLRKNMHLNREEEILQKCKDGELIAYHFLKNTQEIILSTNWVLFFLSGERMKFDDKEHLIPFNMLEILNIIQNTLKEDPLGNKGIWKKAFDEVALIGENAALKKGQIKLFNFRDKKTQAFYDAFLTEVERTAKKI